MTSMAAKEIVVSWDGDPSTWSDYTRKVRLQFEKTPAHKRKHLGPDLASRLTGRAWAVTPSLDHRLLSKKNGTKYLLRFLRDRLCRTAVPDAGARLEDLLIRLRRPLGMGMAQWANEVLETYKKVQRALVRARQQQRLKAGVPSMASTRDAPRTSSEPAAEPPSPQVPRDGHRRERSAPSHGLHGNDGDEEAPDLGEYDPLPTEEPEGERTWWTDEEWRQWRRDQRKSYYDDTSSGEDLAWDELETEDIQVLPDEVLGWLLVRRANLSASSRLSVQASVQNSLFCRDIENALRDQEEELLQADQQRHDRHPKRRTYWVEEEGQWGLLTTMDETVDEAQEIHWVGSQLPSDAYTPSGVGDDWEDDDISIGLLKRTAGTHTSATPLARGWRLTGTTIGPPMTTALTV